MNIKAIAASALIASTTLFGGAEAKAETCFRVPARAGGGAICNTYHGNNAYGEVYTLGYSASEGAHRTWMKVTCRGSYVVDWKSNGNMNSSYLNALAGYFCNL